MKIGIDIRSLNTASYGGVSEYINNLLPALFRAGKEHSFHLFANSYKNQNTYSNLLGFDNVKLYQFNYPNKFLTIACRYIKRPRIDKLLGGVDVFFSPHFLPAPLSSNVKKIITFHDISFEDFPEYFDRRRRIWHKYMSPKTQARSADKLIAVSNSTKEDLEEFYSIAPKKINVVYSGICDSIKNPTPTRWSNIKRKYKIREEYILSLSTIEPRKNIVSLIRAFNSLKEDHRFEDINLVIAGAKGWKYKNILEEAGNSYYKESIIFTGHIKEKEKHILYKKAKVFVYPSLYEGFGFPPLEAMYLGTPTIVSSVTSLPEITQGAAILINPYIPKDITQAMREVLLDNSLSEYLSKKGKEQAQKFNWDSTARETLQILENI